MQFRAVLLCVGTLLFAGCGDDENPSAAELSGEFQAGGVSGLHYVTPTRSGTISMRTARSNIWPAIPVTSPWVR